MSGKLPPSAFEFYLGLGPGRSYQAVADNYGVTKRAITKHAAKERWQERLAELEAKARQTSDQKTLETMESMNVRHLKSIRVIQGKALETLKSMALNTAMEAVRALDLAIRQERTIRGEPSERTAVSVEEVIRKEYERWMGTEGGHDEEGDGDNGSQDQTTAAE